MAITTTGTLNKTDLDAIRTNVINSMKSSLGTLTTVKQEGNKVVEDKQLNKQIFEKCDDKKIINVTSIDGNTYSLSTMEALVQTIVNKVFDAIINKVEVSMKTRMDSLENDVNQLITSIAALTTPPLTPVGLTAAPLVPNIAIRATLKTLETTQLK